jgi:hypothetical protein
MLKTAAAASLALVLLSQPAHGNAPAQTKYEFEHSFKRPFFKPERGILPYWQLGESMFQITVQYWVPIADLDPVDPLRCSHVMLDAWLTRVTLLISTLWPALINRRGVK